MSRSRGSVTVLHDDPGNKPSDLMTSGLFLVAAGMHLSIQSYKPIMGAHFTDDRLEFIRGSTIVDCHSHGSALLTADYIRPSHFDNTKHLRVAKYVEGELVWCPSTGGTCATGNHVKYH